MIESKEAVKVSARIFLRNFHSVSKFIYQLCSCHDPPTK
jgi:hypothetical protein